MHRDLVKKKAHQMIPSAVSLLADHEMEGVPADVRMLMLVKDVAPEG